MAKLIMVLYALSAIITILAFYSMNFLSQPVNNDDYWGGNGNPALFIPVVAMPFTFIFLYGTIEFSMRAIGKRHNPQWVFLGILISTTYILAVSIITYKKADEFRTYIIDKKDAYSHPEEFALFNVFSNHIFFNPFTFIALVAFCFLLGAVWSLIKDRLEGV